MSNNIIFHVVRDKSYNIIFEVFKDGLNGMLHIN